MPGEEHLDGDVGESDVVVLGAIPFIDELLLTRRRLLAECADLLGRRVGRTPEPRLHLPRGLDGEQGVADEDDLRSGADLRSDLRQEVLRPLNDRGEHILRLAHRALALVDRRDEGDVREA